MNFFVVLGAVLFAALVSAQNEALNLNETISERNNPSLCMHGVPAGVYLFNGIGKGTTLSYTPYNADDSNKDESNTIQGTYTPSAMGYVYTISSTCTLDFMLFYGDGGDGGTNDPYTMETFSLSHAEDPNNNCFVSYFKGDKVYSEYSASVIAIGQGLYTASLSVKNGQYFSGTLKKIGKEQTYPVPLCG